MIEYKAVWTAPICPVHTAETPVNRLINRRFAFHCIAFVLQIGFCPIPFLLLENTEKYPQTEEISLILPRIYYLHMQNRYRKMYNENLLGTSDVSILKFYYASFKIQQQKGRIADIDSFLDECIKIAADTSWTFKIFGFIPYFSSKYSTEQQRISKFISLRRVDISALFLKDNITDQEIEGLLYGVSEKGEINRTTEEYLDLVKEKILKCYSIKGKKQLGDRIFGYLLAPELISAYTPEERLNAWHALIGANIAPSDTKLHTTPYLNRSNVDTRTLLRHLDYIREFYSEIGLPKTVHITQKDIDNLSGKV